MTSSCNYAKSPYYTYQQGYPEGLPGISQAPRFHSLEVPEISKEAEACLANGKCTLDWSGCVRYSPLYMSGPLPLIKAPGFVTDSNAHKVPYRPYSR